MSFLDQLLRRKSPPMIGLDVSSSSVKLVELGQTASGDFVLERFALEPFEKGWITDGQIEKFDEVAEAVKRVVAKSGTRTKQVVMAMPQSAVITKKIMLPAGLREEEMELQVESEANQYIPFSLDEVSLDFCVIGPSPTSAGDVEVLIAASRKDRVQDRQGLAEDTIVLFTSDNGPQFGGQGAQQVTAGAGVPEHVGGQERGCAVRRTAGHATRHIGQHVARLSLH